MVAVAKSAMHPGSAAGYNVSTNVKTHAIDEHDHGSEAPTADDEAGGGTHHDTAKTADVCCDTHCAPSHVFPVGFPPLPQPSSGVLAVAVSAAILPGETSDFIRPPRT